jgi:transposase
MSNHNQKKFMGIDVSKDTLDIFFDNKSFKINNDHKSICDFAKSQIDLNLQHFCVFESTGGYERTLAHTLSSLGVKFHVAHPNNVHSFAKASGHFAKTDKLDALLLYKYAKFISDQQPGDILPSKENQEIVDLRRLLKTIEANLHAAQCRLKQMPKICTKFLEAEIKFYKQQINKLNEQIQNKIDSDPDMKQKRDIMTGFKGVGNKIASVIIAEMPEIGTLSRRKVSSLAGVVPKTYQSGKKALGGHIFGGRFYVRKALYMAALVASKTDANVKARYLSLLAKGKAKKVALVAIMHHFIVAINSAIKRSFVSKVA